jgi:hypothetical protein
MKETTCFPYALAYPSDRVTCDLTVFFIPQVPAKLGRLVNLQDLRLYENKLTGTPSLSSLTCIQYEVVGLRFFCPFIPVG